MEVKITHAFTKTFAQFPHFNQHWPQSIGDSACLIQSTPLGASVKGPGSFHWLTPSLSWVQQADSTCTTSVITRGTGRENHALVTSVHVFTIALHSFLALARTLASNNI